jgi:hypothetical protein
MAKTARKSGLAVSGEELGEQLLQSVREMKAGLRGPVHTPEGSSVERSVVMHLKDGLVHQRVTLLGGCLLERRRR